MNIYTDIHPPYAVRKVNDLQGGGCTVIIYDPTRPYDPSFKIFAKSRAALADFGRQITAAAEAMAEKAAAE